jgi:hypothetical protein
VSLLDILLGPKKGLQAKNFSQTSSPLSPLSPPPPQVTEVTEVTIYEEKFPVPAGAILLAPRYDGGRKPLASIPKCWCCKTLYQLERLQEWKGQTYAWLKPGCGCLDTGMCYSCSLCWNHCRCSATDNDSRHKTSEQVFRTPTSDGGAG